MLIRTVLILRMVETRVLIEWRLSRAVAILSQTIVKLSHKLIYFVNRRVKSLTTAWIDRVLMTECRLIKRMLTTIILSLSGLLKWMLTTKLWAILRAWSMLGAKEWLVHLSFQFLHHSKWIHMNMSIRISLGSIVDPRWVKLLFFCRNIIRLILLLHRFTLLNRFFIKVKQI
jgi:hypothetical protein